MYAQALGSILQSNLPNNSFRQQPSGNDSFVQQPSESDFSGQQDSGSSAAATASARNHPPDGETSDSPAISIHQNALVVLT
jgi:hypothetical protein